MPIGFSESDRSMAFDAQSVSEPPGIVPYTSTRSGPFRVLTRLSKLMLVALNVLPPVASTVKVSHRLEAGL